MHTKTFFTTLLASQLALAAVIPVVEHDAGINPISGLPDPGSRLNPVSGLPVPSRRKPQHKHKHHHKHKIVGRGGVNPISGLPAPRVKLHGREAEPEAEPVRIVTNMHTSTKIVWIGRPTPKADHNGAHPKHPKQQGQGHRNQDDQGHRADPGNLSPINGLPAPGSPVYGRPHKGNGQGKDDGQGKQNGHGEQNGKGKQNGQGNHNGQGHQNQPHADRPHNSNGQNEGHKGKPKGIVITPLVTVTVNGHSTVVPAPKVKSAPQKQPAVDHHTSHAPPHNQTPTHAVQLQPSPTAMPKDRDQHHGDHAKDQGVIGKQPSRRDVEYEAPETPEAETPEAYGEYAKKAEQVSAYDEGIAVTENDEDESDFYTGYSPYGDNEADAIFERSLDGADEEVDDEFFETYNKAGGEWWDNFTKAQEAEDEE